MTQTNRQRAIEDFISAAIEKWKDDRRNKRFYPLHVAISDALLASDFCSDSVRELVKKMYNRLLVPEKFKNLTTKERELLRKIVED